MKKIIAFTCLSFITLTYLNEAAASSRNRLKESLHNKGGNNKKIVEDAFKNIVEEAEYNDEMIRQYFSDDYEQHVDGKKMHLPEFMLHMKTLKETKKQLRVEILKIISSGNTVFTNHLVHIENNGKEVGIIKVIAEYRIKDGKIHYCDELTRQQSGDKKDADLGSRLH